MPTTDVINFEEGSAGQVVEPTPGWTEGRHALMRPWGVLEIDVAASSIGSATYANGGFTGLGLRMAPDDVVSFNRSVTLDTRVGEGSALVPITSIEAFSFKFRRFQGFLQLIELGGLRVDVGVNRTLDGTYVPPFGGAYYAPIYILAEPPEGGLPVEHQVEISLNQWFELGYRATGEWYLRTGAGAPVREGVSTPWVNEPGFWLTAWGDGFSFPSCIAMVDDIKVEYIGAPTIEGDTNEVRRLFTR